MGKTLNFKVQRKWAGKNEFFGLEYPKVRISKISIFRFFDRFREVSKSQNPKLEPIL